MLSERIKRAVLVFFGLIVAVLIIEGLLRFLGWGYFYLQERQNTAPLLSTNIQLDQIETGQLNREEGKEFVVLCIGESTTAFGRKHSWPSQLQRILNNIQDQQTFRVINKGISGVHTKSIRKNLQEYLNTYKPDVVLAMVGINDRCDFFPAYCNEFGNFEPVPAKTPSSQFQLMSLLNHFRTYGLIEWISGGIKARVTGKTEDVTTTNVVGKGSNEGKFPVYNLIHSNVTHLHPQTVRDLNDMVNLTTEQGINFVFVQYALRKTDILKSVIERDVFYISNYEIFLELLKQNDYEDLFTDHFAEDFGHATTLGNRIIAGNVARQLLKLFE